MKEILINDSWCDFSFSNDFIEKYRQLVNAKRDSAKLIRAVRDIGLAESCGELTKLAICKIPDESTDWRVCCDGDTGKEVIYYVVKGKIHKADPNQYERPKKPEPRYIDWSEWD